MASFTVTTYPNSELQTYHTIMGHVVTKGQGINSLSIMVEIFNNFFVANVQSIYPEK